MTKWLRNSTSTKDWLKSVKKADGGSAEEAGPLLRWVGKIKLRDAMGGKPPWTAIGKSQRDPISVQDEIRGQQDRGQEILDQVPRAPAGQKRGGRTKGH